MYLHYTSCSINVLLLVGISWFRPVRVDGDGDDSLLFGTVFVIVEVPGLSMSLKQVVTNNVGQSARSETDSWTSNSHICVFVYAICYYSVEGTVKL